jgi:hypothetical protein
LLEVLPQSFIGVIEAPTIVGCEFPNDEVAGVSIAASSLGLKVAQPFDRNKGWKLWDKHGSASWKKTLEEQKPLVAVMTHQMTISCACESVTDFSKYPELVASLMHQQAPLLKLTVWTCTKQALEGRLILLGGLATSRVFSLEGFEKVLGLGKVSICTSLGCQLFLTSRTFR